MAADLFWCPHPEQIWIPGKLKGGKTYETEVGDVDVKEDPEAVGGPEVLAGVNDCCTLANITSGAILHTVRVRYNRGDIYTNISNVLVAVNPFKSMSIYSTEYLDKYRGATDITTMEPHIFGLCSQAFSSLAEQQVSQSVLISGESGAGKTETTKLVLYYTSSALAGQDGGLEDLLMEINPILESFGNAKTVRNNNSSRFGKWIEVQVNPATRALVHVHVIDYLLEVTRVCGQGPGERNYHIFYQLALDPEFRAKYKLENAAQSTFLKTNPLTITGYDDAAEMKNLRRALATLMFTETEEEAIYCISAGILHIGNLEFVEKSEPAKMVSDDPMKLASELLQVDLEAMKKVVLFKRVVVGKETTMSPNDAYKARVAKDSLAKLLYGSLFKWLIAKCNKALGEGLHTGATEADREKAIFMGVLDIAGFESFEKNMFEQLLINFSNEKLQQFFNHTVFKSELDEYKAEAIDFGTIDFCDNADVLELIEKAGDGLLIILDDATTGVRQTDQTYTDNICKKHEKHPRFIKPKFTGKPLFGVRHYAGEVMYCTDNFLEKNVSTVPPEVLELMRSSKFGALQEMGVEDEAGDDKAGGKKKGKSTVAATFRKSLAELMKKLGQSACNFVRCVKPNKDKVPNKFDSFMVMDQLSLCGVMETVKIRKAGFATRPRLKDWASRYMVLLPKDKAKEILAAAGSKSDRSVTKEADAEKVCTGMIDFLQPPKGHCCRGKTKVFMKAGVLKEYEDRRKAALLPFVLRIQKCFRGWRVRKNMREVLDLHKRLLKCVEAAGHQVRTDEIKPKNIARATVAEEGLTMLDLLLGAAAHMTIKLPYLATAVKVRAHMHAEAECARQMVNLQTSTDLPEIQSVVAHAANYKITGPLVAKLTDRIQTIKDEIELRRELAQCVAMETIAEIEVVLKKAKDAGKGAEGWLLDDGREAYDQALGRIAELVESARKAAEAQAALMKTLTDAIASIDIMIVRVALETATANGKVDSDTMTKLKERLTIIEQQAAMIAQLAQCIVYEKDSLVEEVVNKATAADLDAKEKWLDPIGWDALEAAKARLAELRAAGAASSMMNKMLEREVTKMLAGSQDVGAMQAMITRCKGQVTPQLLSDLDTRIKKVQEQQPLRRLLINAAVFDRPEDMLPTLEKCAAAGLSTEAGWVLSDGWKLYRQAQARMESLKETVEVKDRISKAAKEFDIYALEKAFYDANQLGILQSEYVSAEKLHTKMQNAHQLRAFMKEHAKDPVATKNLQFQLDKLTGTAGNSAAGGGSLQVIEHQIQDLVTSCDVPAMQAMIMRAKRAEIKSPKLEILQQRVDKLTEQGPIHRNLKNCAFMDDQEAIKELIAVAASRGLDKPDAWLIKDGFKVVEAAQRRLDELRKEVEAKGAAEREIPELLEKLKESFDVPAMKAAVERAEANKVITRNVDILKERIRRIELESPILRMLRNCLVYDKLGDIVHTIGSCDSAGLIKPGDWLLPDGPKARFNAMQHMEKVKEMMGNEDTVKEQIRRELQELTHSADAMKMTAALAKAHAHKITDDVVGVVERRVDMLKDQTNLLRDLKNCAVFEELVSVQEVISKVRAAGLSSPDSWMLPTGPALLSKAIARMVFLQKAEALLDKLEAAMNICDVKEIKRLLGECSVINVPERRYQPANQLFVDLQKASYVEERLAELKALTKKDSTDLTTIANLVDQLHALGVKTDNIDMKGVAKTMCGRKGRFMSVFFSADAEELKLARQVFQDLGNFSNLRDPMEWSGCDQAGGADPEKRLEAMISWQDIRMTEPLSNLGRGFEQAAKANFSDLMRCMGDLPGHYGGMKEEPILKRVGGDLTDEVYLQVMKQLRNNPGRDSLEIGWSLLKQMLQKGRPSRELGEFLYAFVEVQKEQCLAGGQQGVSPQEVARERAKSRVGMGGMMTTHSGPNSSKGRKSIACNMANMDHAAKARICTARRPSAISKQLVLISEVMGILEEVREHQEQQES